MVYQPLFWLGASTILLVGLVLYLNQHLTKFEKARKKQLFKRKGFEAISTETPLDQPVKTARDIGVESIEARFSNIKKFVIPSVIIILSPITIWPLLGSAPAAVISVVGGTFTVILGIAAKPFIENLISGLVISIGYPLRIGDTVRLDEHYGTVEKISLTYSVIKIWDWRRYVVPNSKILTKEFVNYSYLDKHIWAHVEFFVTPNANLDEVESIASLAAKSSKYMSDAEDPGFWVMGFSETSVRCWIAAWAGSPSNAWELKHDIRKALAIRLSQAGIPFQIQSHQLATMQAAS